MTGPVSSDMKALITARLKEIEEAEDIRILLAIESGSRAWGFHSPDSDYDVRFIYVRPLDWHFRLGRKRDVVERPIDDELDLSGWELSKALSLAVRSNAVIAEWLQSPIVYLSHPNAVPRLQEFSTRALDRKSVSWHYISLLKRQHKRLAHPEGGIRIKRWFYVLRPALALRWMRLNAQAVPPMDLAALRAGCDLEASISQAIDQLLVLKSSAREKAIVETVDPLLDALINDELAQALEWVAAAPKPSTGSLWADASALHMALTLGAYK